MSNDLRFWTSRGVLFGCIAVDLTLLGRACAAGLANDGTHFNKVLFWFVLFLAAIGLSILVAIRSHQYRSQRWEQNQRLANQLAIETLAALGKQRKEAAQNQKKLSATPVNKRN